MYVCVVSAQEWLSQHPNSEVLFGEGDLLGAMAACQSMLPDSEKAVAEQCLFTQVEVAWKERRINVSCVACRSVYLSYMCDVCVAIASLRGSLKTTDNDR